MYDEQIKAGAILRNFKKLMSINDNITIIKNKPCVNGPKF